MSATGVWLYSTIALVILGIIGDDIRKIRKALEERARVSSCGERCER